jgi:hypothetical protein
MAPENIRHGSRYTVRRSTLGAFTAPLLRATSAVGDVLHPHRNDSPILVSGSPRSGTTWIAESISSAVNTERIMWEPLRSANLRVPETFASARPWVDEDSVTAEVDAFLADLIRGKQLNSHLIRFRKYPKNALALLRNQCLLLKFVRGNGVVGYVRRRFGVPKPLVVIRHPCAVVSSQRRVGKWESHPHVSKVLLERNPGLADYVREDASLIERLAMTWAGDVLAAKQSKDDLHILHYEDMLTKGSEAFRSAFRSWGVEDRLYGLDEVLQISSSTTREWSSTDSVQARLSRWQKDLDDKTIDSVLRIVRGMGVTDYSKELLPTEILSQ